AEAGITPQIIERDPQYVALVEQLRAVVERRPDDLRGYVLLAGNEAQLGNFIAAHQAQSRVLEIMDDTAGSGDYANYADLLVLAAGGYVSPEAEAALSKSLRLDRENGTARYYSGLLFAQTGRADLAFRIWQPLLETSNPEDPWVPAIRAQIEEAAYVAGVQYTLPNDGSGPGPSAAEIAASQDMTPEEREAMIRGMVDRLSGRLGRQGGSSQEWARLIGALGVLGETDRARAIWQEAQRIFADEPAALSEIGAEAESAGVSE
ncbi:MAG: tetratricopeptide repeat protein, partial [Halocynthiibacter sp.]